VSEAAAPTAEFEPGRITRAAARGSGRSGLLVFVICFAVYLAGIGLPATPDAQFAPAETRILLTTTSLLDDGDFELTNQYREQAWRAFGGSPVQPAGVLVNGSLIEPHGFLFPALLAPAYALGGTELVQALLALITAFGIVAAAALARRLVPDPWASGAAIAIGCSPPVVIAATAIRPAATCAAIVAAAALLALRVRESPGTRSSLGAGALLALLPWVGLIGVLPGLAIALALFRWLRRRSRGWIGLIAIELVLVSVVFYVSINARLFGGLTPMAASAISNPPTGAATVGDYVDRLPRLLELLVTPQLGLLLTAPLLGMAFVSIALAWRSRRARLARALPEAADVEVAAQLMTAICAAAVIGAVFLLPTLSGLSPGEPLVVAIPTAAALSSWGMRRYPKLGIVLAAIGVALTLWLLIAARVASEAGLAPLSGPLPWSIFGG
jgi:hypothetical protein